RRWINNLLVPFEMDANGFDQAAVGRLPVGVEVKLDLERVIASTLRRGGNMNAEVRSSKGSLLVDVRNKYHLSVNSDDFSAVRCPRRLEFAAHLQSTANVRPHLGIPEIRMANTLNNIAGRVHRYLCYNQRSFAGGQSLRRSIVIVGPPVGVHCRNRRDSSCRS